VTQELIPVIPTVESIFKLAWEDIYASYRARGKYWLREFLGYVLATGWYSVFAIPNLDGSGFIAEVWNPATVYPQWDNELTECAHIFTLSPSEASRLITRNKWPVKTMPTSNTTCYDYWTIDDGGKVINSISLDKNIVKDSVVEPRFSRIPIFTSPVGGLPDNGVINSDDTEKWKEDVGQSVVAVNENIYRYWNKWWSLNLRLCQSPP